MGDTPSSPSISRNETPHRKRKLQSSDSVSPSTREDDGLTTKRSHNSTRCAEQPLEPNTPCATTSESASTATLPDAGKRSGRKYSDFSIETILRRPLVDTTNRPSRLDTSQPIDHQLSSTLLNQRGVSK